MVCVELLHSGSGEAPRGVERFKELIAEWRFSRTGNGKHREQRPAPGADRRRKTPSQRRTNTLKCRQEVQTEVGSRNILRYLSHIIDALILIAAWFRFGRWLRNVPLAPGGFGLKQGRVNVQMWRWKRFFLTCLSPKRVKTVPHQIHVGQ